MFVTFRANECIVYYKTCFVGKGENENKYKKIFISI